MCSLDFLTQSENEVQCRFLLNVIVRQCAPIFELFTCKYQALLVWRDALLVLNFCFDVVDGVVCFHVESDRFASQRLDEDLHNCNENRARLFMKSPVSRNGIFSAEQFFMGKA